MSYLKNEKKIATISFSEIGFDTSIEVAKEIQKEIKEFFTENPDGEVKLEFGGYARLSKPFADALFGKRALVEHMDKISTWQMHIFDGQIIQEVMSK